MAELTNFAQLLEKLAAESAFAQLDPTLALVARRCIMLRWFDPLIVAAFLPTTSETEAAFTADTVINQLAQLPFIERLPWGWSYHEQTRTGLLERYATEQPDLLKQAALLAAPTYQQHPNQALAGQEALFCWLVAGDADKAQQQLDRLIDETWERKNWNGLLALFITSDQAAKLSFVQALQYTAFHQYTYGVALRQLGNHKEAVAAYQQAIALDEKAAYAWNGLGNAYRDSKRYEEAVAAYQQAIALDKKDAYAWSNLGLAYHDLKRYEEAVAAFQQAIALDEKDAYAWNGLGNMYREQKLYDDAIAAYQQAIALDDKFVYPWYRLGNVYCEQKLYDDAIVAYQQATALDANYAAPWNGLGNVYREQQRYDDAIAAYQQAIALDEKDAYPHANLATLFRLLERWIETEASIRHALALDPTDFDLWFGLADVLRRRGDQVGSQEALAQAVPSFDYYYFGATEAHDIRTTRVSKRPRTDASGSMSLPSLPST